MTSLRTTVLTGLGTALALGGCSPLPDTGSPPRAQFFGAAPVVAATPADEALECLAQTNAVRSDNTVFAVHVIVDATQKTAVEDTGGFVPRDTAGMLVTALAKAGVRQVNRSNTAVSEFEINLAREQVLGDGGPVQVGSETVPYRPILRGQLRGSDYVIDGAITQLDFNTYSEGGEFQIFGLGAGRRVFAVTVAADLRVTDTTTTEIVKAQSYSKQAVGYEVYGSVFRFFDEELYDVQIGRKNLEGLHAGIRWMLAEAAYDIVSDLTGHDGFCDQFLPENVYVRQQQLAAEAAGEDAPS